MRANPFTYSRRDGRRSPLGRVRVAAAMAIGATKETFMSRSTYTLNEDGHRFRSELTPPSFPTRSPAAHVGSSGGVPSWILAGCGHRCWVDLFERVEKGGGVRRGLSGHLGKWTRFKYSIIKWKTLFQLYEAQK